MAREDSLSKDGSVGGIFHHTAFWQKKTLSEGVQGSKGGEKRVRRAGCASTAVTLNPATTTTTGSGERCPLSTPDSDSQLVPPPLLSERTPELLRTSRQRSTSHQSSRTALELSRGPRVSRAWLLLSPAGLRRLPQRLGQVENFVLASGSWDAFVRALKRREQRRGR
ncbi:unnamed protein product [Lampetra planeri]